MGSWYVASGPKTRKKKQSMRELPAELPASERTDATHKGSRV